MNIHRKRRISPQWLVAFASIALLAVAASLGLPAAEPSPSEKPPPMQVVDLKSVLTAYEKEIRQCLEDGERGTAAKLAAGLSVLAERMAAESDAEVWRKAMQGLSKELDVQRKLAARDDDRKTIQQAEKILGLLEALPWVPGKAGRAGGPPTVRLRQWMDLGESLLVDAKSAANRGRWEDAQRSLRTLSYVSEDLAAHRNDEDWKKWTDALGRHARDGGAPGRTPTPAGFKETVKLIRAQCDGCHDHR